MPPKPLTRFEESATSWQSYLIGMRLLGNIRTLVLPLDEYSPGDPTGLSGKRLDVANADTVKSLSHGTVQPMALVVGMNDFLGRSDPNHIFFPIIGIYPDLEKEVMVLEAFVDTFILPKELDRIRRNHPGSSWVLLRRLAESRGWRFAMTRIGNAGHRISIRCFLGQSQIDQPLTLSDLEQGKRFHFVNSVVDFAKGLVEMDSRVHDHMIRQKPASGCYVATAVYGSYDCPEVWVLRRWRDSVLARSPLGRLFVRMYYFTSPHLVQRIGHHDAFTSAVRPILDKLVKRLRRSGISATSYTDVVS